jgi:hypothetical protein
MNMEMQQVVEMLAKLLVNQNENQDRMEAIQTKMDSNQKKVEVEQDELKAKTDSNQEKAEARMAKFEEKMDYRKRRMAMLDAHHKNIMACLGQMKANTEKTAPVPEMMQSVEEHQEVPSEDAIVKSVKGRKKRRRSRKSTAGRHRVPKELTRENCGSWRKLGCRLQEEGVPPCKSL